MKTIYIQCERKVRYTKMLEVSDERFAHMHGQHNNDEFHDSDFGQLGEIIDAYSDVLDADDFDFYEVFECDDEGNPTKDGESFAKF